MDTSEVGAQTSDIGEPVGIERGKHIQENISKDGQGQHVLGVS